MSGYFRTAKRNGRWWLVTPKGETFWSMGINHVDSASLRYADSEGVWEKKFENSQETWLRSVKEDLLAWGFNTLGWNQEVVIMTPSMCRHSRSFTYEEYQWLDMPHGHMLPFTEAHQWQRETRHPDVTSSDFEQWCDCVAREECARFKDDPHLIGYFYSDCPQWVHSSPATEWRGSLVDPELQKSEAGREEIARIAEVYYRVTHDAVRRYDPNHLLLGDRFEANASLPEEVVRAAMKYVDVLSFQCFGTAEHIGKKMNHWASFSDMPVLLADAAGWKHTQEGDSDWPPKTHRHHDEDHYESVIHRMWEIPQCVGYHLCGAHIRNESRKYGFRDHKNRLIPETVDGIRVVNGDFKAKNLL